jgi:uncharacterized protein YggE
MGRPLVDRRSLKPRAASAEIATAGFGDEWRRSRSSAPMNARTVPKPPAARENTMRTAPIIAATILVAASTCRALVGGNVSFAQAGGRGRAEAAERAKRTLGPRDVPPPGSTFVEATVLMNVKADEFVAVFGVAQEGETVEECGRKMDAAIREFTEALRPLNVAADALFVDFVAQNRIYGFEVVGDMAREKLVGFELKKNVSIHYQDRDRLDRLVVAAAKSKIYDLIKVDYVVKDTPKIQARLMDEAARVVKEKSARYETLLGIKLQPPGQVYAERPAIYYPTQMYDAYTAFEAESIDAAINRQKYTVQSARKSRTFFFNGLDADGFDLVINPVIIEPVVQFTLYLKIKYEVEQAKAR